MRRIRSHKEQGEAKFLKFIGDFTNLERTYNFKMYPDDAMKYASTGMFNIVEELEDLVQNGRFN